MKHYRYSYTLKRKSKNQKPSLNNGIQERGNHIIVSAAGGVLIGAAIISTVFPAVSAVIGAGIGAVGFAAIDALFGGNKLKEKES